MDRDLWDAQEVAGELVPPGSVFAFLAEHRRELFDDSFTADLFDSGTGRPSLPADLVGAVLVLKEMYALSDPQTAEALRFDIRWKVACGRSLTATSFHPSTLVYWRRRIAESARPDRVFDKVAEVIAETGILKGRRKRCVDSTVFDDAVPSFATTITGYDEAPPTMPMSLLQVPSCTCHGSRWPAIALARVTETFVLPSATNAISRLSGDQ